MKDVKNIHKKYYGYPVTINSENENDYITRFLSDHTNISSINIGLNDLDNEGKWVWFNKSNSNFTKWARGEPNNWKSREDYVSLMIRPSNQDLLEGKYAGTWNDIRGTNDSIRYNYLFEWDQNFIKKSILKLI